MANFINTIAFVVPTKDHPKLLRQLLASIEAQSYLPDQLIIVDGGDEVVEEVVNEFPSLGIRYLREYPPSLSKQRNAGIAVVDRDITLAGYLDDDVILEPGAMEAMLTFWDTASADVGGARFHIINEKLPRSVWIKSLFLAGSRQKGIVLSSGYTTPIGPISENLQVRWLSGGVTLWRSAVIKEFDYDEWFEGTGYLEDVDYSYNVGRKYKLVAVADARVQHLSNPIRKNMNYLLGKWQVTNRMYFVKKYPDLSVPLCYFAVCGQMVFNLAKSAAERDSVGLRRALGNLVGLFRVSTGRIDRIGGILK